MLASDQAKPRAYSLRQVSSVTTLRRLMINEDITHLFLLESQVHTRNHIPCCDEAHFIGEDSR
ncbi:MAG: hypothetical protein D6775_11515 [Caldilineae bacterium]|nr:MAG: hypothetical protein D6775_11515 [Caldilineae bacterium]